MPLSALPLPVLVVFALLAWAMATRHVVAALDEPQWVAWSATVTGPAAAVLIGLLVPEPALPAREVLAGWVCAWILIWSVTGGKPMLLMPPGPSTVDDRSRARRAALLFIGVSLALIVGSSIWPSAFLVQASA